MGAKEVRKILEDVVLDFVEEFPEYKIDLQEHLDYLDEILPYVFFPDVFYAHIESMLRENIEIEKLESLFAFFERMITSGDEDINTLICLTILEDIMSFEESDPVIFANGKKYCGPQSLQEMESMLNWTPEIASEEKAQKKKKKQQKKPSRKEAKNTKKRTGKRQ